VSARVGEPEPERSGGRVPRGRERRPPATAWRVRGATQGRGGGRAERSRGATQLLGFAVAGERLSVRATEATAGADWLAEHLDVFSRGLGGRLTVVEILWKHLKYSRLKARDYADKETPRAAVKATREAVGTTYRIDFSPFKMPKIGPT
jgi:hypothetical protein